MRSPSTPHCSRPSRSVKGKPDRSAMSGDGLADATQPGDAAGKVAQSLEALSVAQAALHNLQAALAAGRAPSPGDIGKLTNVTAALAEAAGVLGLDPARATVADLKAELAARESSGRHRPVLRRLARAEGPPAAAEG